ncbi:hypothetical protein ACFSQ7_45015 [Paenibacillus rhizoplanae]
MISLSLPTACCSGRVRTASCRWRSTMSWRFFYEIEQGNEALYTDNKNAILGGLLSYLKPEGKLDSRVRLNDMFLERFDREYDLIRKKGIPSVEILELFKSYYALPGHNYRVKIVDYFINGMLNCQSGGREDVLAAAYGIIESNAELSEAFFSKSAVAIALPQSAVRAVSGIPAGGRCRNGRYPPPRGPLRPEPSRGASAGSGTGYLQGISAGEAAAGVRSGIGGNICS